MQPNFDCKPTLYTVGKDTDTSEVLQSLVIGLFFFFAAVLFIVFLLFLGSPEPLWAAPIPPDWHSLPTTSEVFFNTDTVVVALYSETAEVSTTAEIALAGKLPFRFIARNGTAEVTLVDEYGVYSGTTEVSYWALDSDLLDNKHGTWYLARANHTGTQVIATISDFPSQTGNPNKLLTTDGYVLSWATGQQTIGFSWNQVSIASGGVATVDPGITYGLMKCAYNGSSPVSHINGSIGFRTGTGAWSDVTITDSEFNDGGVRATAPTGTTGPNGKLNIFVSSASRTIWFENRLGGGASATFNYTFEGKP